MQNQQAYHDSFPSSPITPILHDPRPASTRFVHFPILVNARTYSNHETVYSPETCFAPNVRNPPNFAQKVDIEMDLRNQFVALQHGADQGIYVPSSTSDMYVQPTTDNLLAKQTPPPIINNHEIEKHMKTNHIGTNLFHNHTRFQLRNS